MRIKGESELYFIAVVLFRADRNEQYSRGTSSRKEHKNDKKHVRVCVWMFHILSYYFG